VITIQLYLISITKPNASVQAIFAIERLAESMTNWGHARSFYPLKIKYLRIA